MIKREKNNEIHFETNEAHLLLLLLSLDNKHFISYLICCKYFNNNKNDYQSKKKFLLYFLLNKFNIFMNIKIINDSHKTLNQFDGDEE